MASGQNHDRAIIITFPFMFLGGVSLTSNAVLSAIMASSYLLGGLYLSPDLDISYSNPSRRWGRMRKLWFLYRIIVPRHRHPLSHWPIIGSVGRIFYLICLLSPILIVASWHPMFSECFTSEGAKISLISAFLGIEFSALNHLVLDGLIVPLPHKIKKGLAGLQAQDVQNPGSRKYIKIKEKN